MPYREQQEIKVVKHRLILTRGEVDLILRAKLVADGLLPEGFDKPVLTKDRALRGMAVLTSADRVQVPERLPGGADPPWSAWPAYTVEWDEEISK